MPWTKRADHQHLLALGEPAHRGGRDEQDETRHEDGLAADQVAVAPGQQQQPAEADQVRVHDPRQARLREAEVVLDGGKRDVHDRHVEHDHQHARAEHVERNPAVAVRLLVLAHGRRLPLRSHFIFETGVVPRTHRPFRFGCQKAISPPAGVATTLRHPAGPSRGSRRTRAPSAAGSVGGLVDLADLNVRQPHRTACLALDDTAPEAAAQLERQIRPRGHVDLLGAPAAELRVERLRLRQVAGVQLEVHEGFRRFPHLPEN